MTDNKDNPNAAAPSGSDIELIRKVLLGGAQAQTETLITQLQEKLDTLENSLRADNEATRTAMSEGLEKASALDGRLDSLETRFNEHEMLLRTLAESVQRALAVQVKGVENEVSGLREQMLGALENARVEHEKLRTVVQEDIRGELAELHRLAASKMEVEDLPELLEALATRVRASRLPHKISSGEPSGDLEKKVPREPLVKAPRGVMTGDIEIQEVSQIPDGPQPERIDLKTVNSDDIAVALAPASEARQITPTSGDIPILEPHEP